MDLKTYKKLSYQAIRFLHEELQDAYYDQGVLISKSLAGIAIKYDAFNNGDDKDSLKVEIELNVTPEIVITETFID